MTTETITYVVLLTRRELVRKGKSSYGTHPKSFHNNHLRDLLQSM